MQKSAGTSEPKIQRIRVEDLDKLSIRDGKLYWNDEAIVTQQRLVLSKLQKAFGAVLVIATTLAAITTVVRDVGAIVDECVLGIPSWIGGDCANASPEPTTKPIDPPAPVESLPATRSP